VIQLYDTHAKDTADVLTWVSQILYTLKADGAFSPETEKAWNQLVRWAEKAPPIPAWRDMTKADHRKNTSAYLATIASHIRTELTPQASIVAGGFEADPDS
jgi:hypothetical protein